MIVTNVTSSQLVPQQVQSKTRLIFRSIVTIDNALVSRTVVAFGFCGLQLTTSKGIAAAFQAPTGGILFSLEEASSFWSLKLVYALWLYCCVLLCSGVVAEDLAVGGCLFVQ